MKMKKIKVVLVLVLSLLLLASCQKEDKQIKLKYYILDELYYEKLVDSNSDLMLLEEPFKEGYKFVGWFLDKNFNERPTINYLKNNKGLKKLNLYAKFIEPLEFPVPILNINLKDNYPLSSVDRQTYIDALISLNNLDEQFELTDVKGEFRGRGHGSWEGFEKKGFKIKFNKKQALFGLASNKHWVLVPGGHDKSLIRHNLAYMVAKEALGINYQTAVHEVELYVNGLYRGVYSLFEHIRVAEGRVDIDSKYNVLDTGYLIEYDTYAEGREGIEYFKVAGLKYPFLIKGPKMADYESKSEMTELQARAQTKYIKDYVTSVIEAIFNKDQEKFMNLADANSFVDMYILHELFKNSDTGWSSFYLYKKPGGKLSLGPAWDFDLSSGVNRGDQTPENFYVSGKGLGTAYQASNFTSSEIYIELMTQQWFVDLYNEKLIEKADAIKDVIENYYLKIQYLDEAYKRDAVRWTNGQNTWKIEQDKLYDWLNTRLDWLVNWSLNN